MDICALNNVVVADSGAGISIFNVFTAMNPIIIAQVDTPGIATAVSCSGNLISVADGDAGLAVIDISDPAGAGIIWQISRGELGGGSTQAVVSVANLTFVGTTDGVIRMVDIGEGIVLQRITLGGRVEDVAIEGKILYAYANGKLYALPFDSGLMTIAGSVNVPGSINTAHGRGRLFGR